METHGVLSVSVFCCLLLLNGVIAEETSTSECEQLIQEALKNYEKEIETADGTTACEYLKTRISSECLFQTGRCVEDINNQPLRRKRRRHTESQAKLDRRSKRDHVCPRNKEMEIDLECTVPQPVCSITYKYRTFDGSCNNLMSRQCGRANRIQSRFLRAAYDDGCGTPRSKDKYGDDLPNPRRVSNIIHAATEPVIEDPIRSVIIMQMGQFLAHDFILTRVFTKPNGEALKCCDEDMNNTQCLSIYTPADDPHFPPGTCLNFARSEARQNCVNGVRDQVNSQSSMLDLSMVYGSSVQESNTLRSLSGGLLKEVQGKLPKDSTDSLCKLSMPSDETSYYCPIAGDPRLTETSALAAFHTVWMREHNRLARGLAEIHSDWNDETLFQEARKIAIAEWQHIVYAEYLPAIMGLNDMISYGIDVTPNGYKDTYNPFVDPTLTNSFGAAIFRYGHSLVQDRIGLANVDDGFVFFEEDLKDNFQKPEMYHINGDEGTDTLLKWQSTKRCPLSDRFLEKSVQTFLFFDQTTNMSLDLATFNIHRGREHGVPGYNEFRELCGLPRAFNFTGLVDHTSEVANLLAQVYAHPDDIDLFTAFVSEKRLDDSQFGPTGQCIMLEIFKRLRNGDRFFYERKTLNPSITFSLDQLDEIKNVTMSTVFCLNTAPNPGKKVPENMFFVQSTENDYVQCSTVQGIDLSKF